MTRNKIILVGVFVLVTVALYIHSQRTGSQSKNKTTVITPVIGDVIVTVTTTGIVEPQNRLEIKPSISGRVESILVREGDMVKQGDVLAWMSSIERAALVDAAHSQGTEVLEYWQEVYKKTPIISPIDGEVIVRAIEPGQTVTTADAILVLSDRLIINAQFDETDIGRVRLGQEAFITLDAYPEVKMEGAVDHIAYESQIVNNVTIYEVDILPKEMPEILRSGMSVTVDVVEETAKGVVTIPSGAIEYDGDKVYVMLQQKRGKAVERDIQAGLNNDKSVEVISGLTTDDKVITKDNSLLPKQKSLGTNPFMPSRRRNNR